MGDMDGRVVALVGRGDEVHRALAVACAEAGASIALGTVEPTQDQEFAVNSIANELWAIGREHFVRVMDAAEPTSGPVFADECWDTLRRCDALVVMTACESSAPIEELSSDEWEAVLRAGATAAFLQLQAFGRLMVREGGGLMLAAFPRRDGADAAERAALAALRESVEVMDAAWRPKGVRCRLVEQATFDDVLAGLPTP